MSLVHLGDGLVGLRSLRGEAALVLSDLPSGETRAPHDDAPDLEALWPAIWSALRPDGSAVLMASSLRFAAKLLASQPDAYRYDLVWAKSIAVGFLNARARPLRAHEFLLVFSRAQGIYNPQMTAGHPPISSNFREAGRRLGRNSVNYDIGPRTNGRDAGRARTGATDRFPQSVLTMGSVGVRDPQRVHPQQKPDALMEHCVRTYSSPGDLVVDPFAGSGTTGRAALACGRRFVGWDINPLYGASGERACAS